MKFGPIMALFVRSVREEGRAKSPYIARFLLVAVVLLSLYSGYRVFSMSQGSAGLGFFVSLTTVNAVFTTLAGIAFFSSAITEEKEEGTIALLRMTKLSPVAILLGKSTSRLFGATLLILAQLPFTLLAVSLGGVTNIQVFAAYATLISWIFFLANLALFCSVVRARSTSAASMTFLLLVAMYLIPAIFNAIVEVSDYKSVFHRNAALGSLLVGYVEFFKEHEFVRQIGRILSPLGYAGNILSPQVWLHIFMGIALFLLSWVSFNRFNRELKDASPERSAFSRSKSGDKSRRILAPARAWAGAIFWKDFFFSRSGWIGMPVRVAVVGIIIAIVFLIFGSDYYSTRTWLFISVWVILITGLLDMAISAAKLFASESKLKTLSSLAILPHSTGSIAYQKIGALMLSMLPYLLMLFAALLFFDEDGIGSFFEGVFSAGGIFAIMTIMVTLHLTALFSLTIRGGPLAAVLLAGIVTILGIAVLSMLGVFMVSGSEEGIFVFFSLCFIALCAFLQVVIGRRLEKLAASE